MRTLSSALLLLGLCFAAGASAQTISFDRGYALVFPKDGIGFSVRSLQVYGDSIICLSPELRVLAKSDISKIMIRNDKPRGNGAGIGAVMGVYVLHYFIGRADNQPGAFLSYSGYGDNNNSGLIWTTLLGITLGGGVGYLTETHPGTSELTPYIFAGNAEIINEQWRLFLEDATNDADKPKFHFSLSGGSVTTPTTNGYKKMLEAKGFTKTDQTYYGDFFFTPGSAYVQKSTDFNWLRKAELSYSLTDNIHAGIACTWLGEPALFARKSQEFSSTSEIYEFLERVDGKGYYATGGYHYYLTRKKDLELSGTLGVGIANMDHTINAWYRRNSSDDPTEAVITDKKTYFSFITSGGIGYSLYNNLTLGLTANYFYGGSSVMKDIFIIDLPSMDVTYSTLDVGFTLEMHF